MIISIFILIKLNQNQYLFLFQLFYFFQLKQSFIYCFYFLYHKELIFLNSSIHLLQQIYFKILNYLLQILHKVQLINQYLNSSQGSKSQIKAHKTHLGYQKSLENLPFLSGNILQLKKFLILNLIRELQILGQLEFSQLSKFSLIIKGLIKSRQPKYSQQPLARKLQKKVIKNQRNYLHSFHNFTYLLIQDMIIVGQILDQLATVKVKIKERANIVKKKMTLFQHNHKSQNKKQNLISP
ncbi:hypothetical protein TTHERM_001208739 (macronuclear) [Tetrahymena thermophila SB210]|uniref:Uncharacterized protein n=1 Tax=Tetrahymena thermophila (strain SB210) TaxID=312017 RepID=W7X8G8_TETTS|nr:hypothetical protein TTHERM_001208739 [Tetrahymena thermophila SB210]EWS73642.1 hypothetical protein TTHERM_001208739 [Tetrahymena thermophila SB210]|eukprot:XP_012653820.1 hypothetical protein TTHERM_001208739 [Tetrahymena thermophila SB210]